MSIVKGQGPSWVNQRMASEDEERVVQFGAWRVVRHSFKVKILLERVVSPIVDRN